MISVKGDASLDQDEQRWAELMISTQAGNEADCRQLFTELSQAISRYLCHRIGYHHFIEDCVQDSLIAIHQARHTYDSRRLFRPWLFAIVRHKAVDTLRRQQSYHKVLEKQFNNSLLKPEAAHCQLSENSITQNSLLKALEPNSREAITLTKIIGLSTAEAANKLSISENTLKVRVHRAVKRLKKILEAEEA